MGLNKRMFKHISALLVMDGKVGLEVATEWANEVAQLIEILKEVEWQGHDAISNVCCPICGAFYPSKPGEGHEEGCILKAALGGES